MHQINPIFFYLFTHGSKKTPLSGHFLTPKVAIFSAPYCTINYPYLSTYRIETQSAPTKDEKRQRLRKIIDKKTGERFQDELSNPDLFARMPPLERIQSSALYPPTDSCRFARSDYPPANNQSACFSQNLRTIRKQRWKSSQEILALPSHDGYKVQTEIGITRNSQSLDYETNIEKKNR